MLRYDLPKNVYAGPGSVAINLTIVCHTRTDNCIYNKKFVSQHEGGNDLYL